MMRTFLIFFVIAIMVSPAVAQDTREATMTELAKKLVELNKIVAHANERAPENNTIPKWPVGSRYDAVVWGDSPVAVYKSPDGTSPSGTLVQPGAFFHAAETSEEYTRLASDDGKNIGWVNSQFVRPANWVTDTVDEKIDEALAYITDLYEAYKDNAFVSVSGFNIVVGLTPSVGVNFEFK